MSITISFVDLRLADTLKQYNSVQMLSLAIDKEINAVLEQLGFDITKEIEYIPSRHRTLTNKVVVDYQAVGEMNRDKKYNHLRDATLRTVAAGYSDASLAREMSALQGNKNTYRNTEEQWNDGKRAKPDDHRYYTTEQLLEMGYSKGDEDDEYEGSSDYIEDDWEQVARTLKTLEELRDSIRNN